MKKTTRTGRGKKIMCDSSEQMIEYERVLKGKRKNMKFKKMKTKTKEKTNVKMNRTNERTKRNEPVHTSETKTTEELKKKKQQRMKNVLWVSLFSVKKGIQIYYIHVNSPKANSINCRKQHLHHSHFLLPLLLLIIIVCNAFRACACAYTQSQHVKTNDIAAIINGHNWKTISSFEHWTFLEKLNALIVRPEPN